MWRRLDDSELLPAFMKELVLLLTAVAAIEYTDRICAVTSLNRLRFTPAPRYSRGDKYDEVLVGLRDGLCTVSYVEAGARDAVWSATGQKDEVLNVLDQYFFRLLHPMGWPSKRG